MPTGRGGDRRRLGSVMRELVQSKWIVGLLVGFYVLASQAALPVPTLVFTAVGSSSSGDAACVSVCKCVGCSPETCCCAMVPMGAERDDDSGLVKMLAFSCQPDLQWFLAGLPPLMLDVRVPAAGDADRCVETALSDLLMRSDRAVGVPTPPPKTTA